MSRLKQNIGGIFLQWTLAPIRTDSQAEMGCHLARKINDGLQLQPSEQQLRSQYPA